MSIRHLTQNDGDSVVTCILISMMLSAPAGLVFGIFRWWNTIIPPQANENLHVQTFFSNIVGFTVLGALCGIGLGLGAFAIIFILSGIWLRVRRTFFLSVEDKLAEEIVLALKYIDQYDNARSDKKAEKIGQLKECLERAYSIYDPAFDAVRK